MWHKTVALWNKVCQKPQDITSWQT